MAIFAISDLHLSLASDKPMDVFPGWEHYLEQLSSRWKNLVSDTDTVVIPGDFSWALKLEDTKRDFAYLNALPGQKILLKGNHDLWWSTMKKLELFLAENEFTTVKPLFNSAVSVENAAICGTRGWNYDAPESEQLVRLREAGRLDRSITAAEQLGGEVTVFLHFPPAYGDFVCREIVDVLHDHHITHLYYGHVHGVGRHHCLKNIEGIDMDVVSCDLLSFTPKCIKP